jgi:erythromycin esterase-like protein
LTPLLGRIGRAPLALLGEASHGTSEFYGWRAALSRRLIEEAGFRFVAVEGDWPDCYRVNRYVKGRPGSGRSARDVLHAFDRWPTWMWANAEVAEFVEWLRGYNAGQAEERKVGFYGLDVYSLWESLYALAAFARRHDPAALGAIARVVQCFEPYGEDAQEYARASLLEDASCESVVGDLVEQLTSRGRDDYDADGREGRMQAEQNAWVLKGAEAYYRAMVRGGSETWNIRDRHMVDTLGRLMEFHEPGAKGVLWEHNTHIGDARYTDMHESGEVNVGQLVRERYGEQSALLVGFSTYCGSVVAGRGWDAPMQAMRVPPGRPGSWEDVLHRAGASDKLLMLGDLAPTEELLEPRGQRAIGVVYHPEYEHLGNYVETVLSRRYDALLYIDETSALRPLLRTVSPRRGEVDDTFPSTM